MAIEPHPIEAHVGSRLRLRRTMIGMTQERLGELVDLSFQQVQKYEKGTNRIGASRLFMFATILDVPIDYFFQDMPNAVRQGVGEPDRSATRESDQTPHIMKFVASEEGLKLNAAFSQIEDRETRRKLADLVKTLAKVMSH